MSTCASRIWKIWNVIFISASSCRKQMLDGSNLIYKHCQRHNGPEGWVHLAKVILQGQTQILIEFHLQNLDSASTRNLNQTSASPLNLEFKILTQPSFRISTKIQLHNLYKTSAAKCWTNPSFKILLNFNIKILTNPCTQSLKKV